MTVTLGAPNKTFNIAGLGIANAIIPDRRLRDAFMNQAANLGLGIANVFGIVAQEAAYSKGEAWLEELLAYLRGNYERLASFLAERLPSLSVLPLEGTYLAWIDCRAMMAARGVADPAAFFEAAGVGLSTVSQQLRILRAERVVTRRRAGKHIFYGLADSHIVALLRSAIEHAAEPSPHDHDHDE